MSKLSPISIALAEDNEVFRLTVKSILEEAEDIRFFGYAGAVEPFKAIVEERTPDIALLDLAMEHEDDGITILEWLQAEHPDVKVVIMTVNETEISHCYELGARAYILKSNLDDIVDTLKGVQAGQVIIPANVGELLISQVKQRALMQDLRLEIKLFSEREIEILRFIRQKVPREVMAGRLCISDHTIKRHLENVRAKHPLGSVPAIVERFSPIL